MREDAVILVVWSLATASSATFWAWVARSLVFGPDGDAQPQMTSDALRNLEAPRVRGHLQPTEPETENGEDLREQMAEATA